MCVALAEWADIPLQSDSLQRGEFASAQSLLQLLPALNRSI